MESCFSPHQKQCHSYVNRSAIHDMFLPKVHKRTLSAFDENCRFINEIESLH